MVDASTWSHDELSYDPDTRKISSALDRTEDASAKGPELVAEHEKKHLTLHVSFYDARNPKRSSPSQVDVRLGSRCFRFAPGETRDDAGGSY